MTAVWTSYPAQALLPFFDPPIELAGLGPRRNLHRERRVDFSTVRFDARTIPVRHNRVSVDGRVQETTTKTRSGRRTVPLSDAGVAALLTWQLHPAEERRAAQEAWIGDDHVFTMEDGRPLDPAYITRLFQKIRMQGEPLPALTFHGLRHCFASLMWPVAQTSPLRPSSSGTARSASLPTSTATSPAPSHPTL